MKKLLFSHFSVIKGLIQHVVQSCYNYNLTFRKLEIHTVKMRPISACYTSGRGNSLDRALFGLRPLHYWGVSILQRSAEIFTSTTAIWWISQAVTIKHTIKLKPSCTLIFLISILVASLQWISVVISES